MAVVGPADVDEVIAHVRAGDFADIPEWQRSEMADQIDELWERAADVDDLKERITELEGEIERYRKALGKLADAARSMTEDIRDELA